MVSQAAIALITIAVLCLPTKLRAQDASAGGLEHRVLATSKTSTMQRELQAAGDAGYQYRGQTVFASALGGDEVVVILEKDGNETQSRYDYKLLATSKTSTLEKELRQAGQAGFEVVGLTVGTTTMGGRELVAITRRAR